MNHKAKRQRAARPLAAAALALAAGAACLPRAHAQDAPAAAAAAATPAQIGLVLDAGYATREIALGERGKGWHLGGAEAMLDAPIAAWLQARLTLSAHGHGGHIDKHVEEAWLDATATPAALAGWQLRGGRMLSQVGYLNEQHPHADDFATRPLAYRAFLGGHYFDDGLRLNWTAPTPLYWRSGIELFRGRQLTREAARQPRPGVWTLSTKLGGDIGAQHSWQIGLSHLGNRRAAHALQDDDHDSHDHGHGHGHDHSHHGHVHGAALAGSHLWMIDGVWKWAPNGNNRQRQLRLNAEWAQQSGLGPNAASGARNRAGYAAITYRFAPEWEVGWRTDWLRGHLPHGDHFHRARLREHSVALSYKPSHQQALRLQYTHQSKARSFAAQNGIFLQYVISFGAHGAHSF